MQHPQNVATTVVLRFLATLGRGAWRRWLLMALWAALYISPVFVRGLTRVVGAYSGKSAVCW